MAVTEKKHTAKSVVHNREINISDSDFLVKSKAIFSTHTDSFYIIASQS